MLFLKLRTAGLLNLKIEWANSISIQNWVMCGVATPKDNVWIDIIPLHKNNRKGKQTIKKNTKSFSHKKENMWSFVIKVISFSLKDNFIIEREPLVCGIIFYYCPIVSIVQTVWMVDCGYQRVVYKKRRFVVVSDSDLKMVIGKVLEKLVIFDNLITFNTKTLKMNYQDGSRFINWSISDAFLTGITWSTEPFIF